MANIVWRADRSHLNIKVLNSPGESRGTKVDGKCFFGRVNEVIWVLKAPPSNNDEFARVVFSL